MISKVGSRMAIASTKGAPIFKFQAFEECIQEHHPATWPGMVFIVFSDGILGDYNPQKWSI